MKLRLLFLGLLVGFLSATAFAHTEFMQDLTCPIDGHRWKQKMDGSGTQFGMRLDMRPLGPTPAPWKIPHCPKCRFAFVEPREGEEKIPVEKLKPYILSEGYRTAAKDQPSYYCFALSEAFQGAEPNRLGHLYLKASWQVENDPAKCREHLNLALTNFRKALKAMTPEEEQYQTTAILCGELERRTERFDEARRHFEGLLKTKAFAEEFLQKLLKRELEFIAKNDSAPHAIEDKAETYVKSSE